MNAFIIGDIHGCFYTLEKMLSHWEPSDQKLVCVGDYIDRGNYSGRVLKLLWELQISNPETLFLKGNHEFIFKHHYLHHQNNKIERGIIYHWPEYCSHCFVQLENIIKEDISVLDVINFIDTLQLNHNATGFMVSHAGITQTDTDVYAEDNYEFGILWTRKELKNIGKPQIIGHTPHELQTPLINTSSNSYNIDSGCCYGRGLTGIVMSDNGNLLETFYESVDVRDIC